MKTAKLALCAILLVGSFVAKAQTIVDTSKTANAAVLYITDSASFKTSTMWVYKVTTYNYQFQQQNAPDGVDSFTVKKVKVPVKVEYLQKLYTLGNKWIYKPVTVLAEFKYPN